MKQKHLALQKQQRRASKATEQQSSAEIEEELERANGKLTELKERYDTVLQDQEKVVEELKAKEERQDQLTRVRDENDKIKRRLQETIAASAGSNDAFHRVKQDMARTEFDVPPVGPVYQHLKMKEESMERAPYQNSKFALGDVVESLIGAQLQTFLVATQNDYKAMQGILRKHRKNCPIAKTTFFERDGKTRKRRFAATRLVRTNSW